MRLTASPAAASARSPASKRNTSTAKIHCSPSPQAAVCHRMAFRLVEISHATNRIATSPSKPVNRPKLFSLLRAMQRETVGEKLFEAIIFPTRVAAKNDPGGRQHELAQYLQTSPTRRAGRLVQIGDGAGKHARLRAVLGNGANHGRALRANGEPVGGVLHVGPG